MSSASSGRYQSRLFNFFHRQSRHLKQQSDRALGNLQVAATWVATVGLYPLYALFQSTSSGTRQVNQAVQQSLPQLPVNNLDYLDPPSTDTPIQRVLLAVDTLSSEYAIVTISENKKPANLLAFFASWRLKFFSNSPHTSSLTQPEPSPSLTYNHLNIQGIATQLSSRTLVLITAQNQILDIFNFQQQKRLQERIIDEVASYWSYQRLAHSIKRREARGVDASATLCESEAAQRAMLEGEKRIYPFRVLAIVDRTVARLESKHLAPVVRHEVSTLNANLSKRGWNIVQQVQKITVSLSGQPVGSKIPAIATHKTEITVNNFEGYKFRLQTLIFAAINYFFGSHNTKQAIATAPKTNSTQPKLRNQRTFKLPTATSVDRDPWLTLDDLFGEPELPGVSTFDQQNASTLKQLAGNTNLIPSNSTRHSLRNLRDRVLQLPASKQVSGRVLRQKTTKSRRREADKQLSLPKSAGYPRANQISNQTSTQNTQVEAKPDWIETNATAIGYVKHPLEKILEWLDRLILWLEEMLVRVLGRLQRLWQGK